MRALLLIAVAMLNATTALADAGDLNKEIQAFLDGYAAAYNRQDYAALLALWDRQDESPIYMAEEIDPPMHGWKKIDAYFARPGVLDGIRNEYTNVDAHYLAPDLAIATYRLRFDIQVKNMKPLSSWDRVMAVFRRKDGQWKLTGYAEAPMAPLTMVRKMAQKSGTMNSDEQKALLAQILALLQASVPPDFEQWLRQQPQPKPAE
jgi:ketosteroid isomerase-like protein